MWISQEWALTIKQILRKPETDSLDCMTILSFHAEEPNPESFAVPPDFKTEIMRRFLLAKLTRIRDGRR